MPCREDVVVGNDHPLGAHTASGSGYPTRTLPAARRLSAGGETLDR
ncbi:hypothetical protein [Rhodococcus jostii]